VKKAKGSIRSKILWLTVASCFILSAILLLMMVYSINKVSQSANTIVTDSMLKQVQSSVKNSVQVLVSNSQAQYNKEKGAMDEQTLINKVLDNIRNTKYSTSGYYFVYTYDGIRLVAPENKAQEGKNLFDLTDAAGGKPVQEFIKQSKAGGGFVEYMWLNPTSNTNEQKLSYVSPLKLGDTEIIVGTGTYLPMIEEAKAQVNSSIKGQVQTLLTMIIPAIVLITVLILIFSILFYSKSIINPIKEMKKTADKLALGEIDFNIHHNSKDEIGDLVNSFKVVADNIQQQAAAAQSIANGNMDVTISARSEKDLLSISMLSVMHTLNSLSGEFDMLIQASEKGDFKVRGNLTQFKGQYAVMLSGVNSILDEVATAFDQVEAASKVADKKSDYQEAEVKKLVTNLARLANGELACDMEVAPGDEDTRELRELYESISSNLHHSVDTIKSYVDEISYSLGEMADGNLQISITNEYMGEFVALKDSINAITKSLNEILMEIHTSANQVASGTSQVSDGAQALSQGATEQASAIEQLTVSIGQIAGQTKQNALNAGQASGLSATALDNALTGNRHMQEMLTSMQDINDASANISKIIKVIDDIAFQTNLLALNAAVEAARAGQYGKGFAVVAEEVRSLAARSANAAKETTELIEGTVRKVDAGTKIARDTAEALGSIMGGIQHTTELVKDIAAASNEQATAVEQISRGIDQVAQVVQTTSATAEESAATSEELSGQAEYLKEMVGRFTLQGNVQSASMLHSAGAARPIASAKPNKPQILLNGNGFLKR
jgi:methyl-accepting chemotaxis protein